MIRSQKDTQLRDPDIILLVLGLEVYYCIRAKINSI